MIDPANLSAPLLDQIFDTRRLSALSDAAASIALFGSSLESLGGETLPGAATTDAFGSLANG